MPEKICSLTITQRIGEAFTIDGKTRVLFVSRKGDQVRLRIEAPQSVKILRTELKPCEEK